MSHSPALLLEATRLGVPTTSVLVGGLLSIPCRPFIGDDGSILDTKDDADEKIDEEDVDDNNDDDDISDTENDFDGDGNNSDDGDNTGMETFL